jgi:hypothetical protein
MHSPLINTQLQLGARLPGTTENCFNSFRAREYRIIRLLLLILFPACFPALAQTIVPTRSHQTNQTAVRDPDQRAADIRAACIYGRRCVCGKVIQIVPEGLIVESGYTALMRPPFTGSWVIPSGALVNRDSNLIERDEPASPCIGTVLLTDFPKRPAVKLYDYVLLQAYPAGEYLYVPVPGVEKQIRKFAGGLDTAVRLKVAAEK